MFGSLPVDQLKYSQFNKEERIKLSLAHAHLQSQIGLFESPVVIVDYFNYFFFLGEECKRKNDLCMGSEWLTFLNLLSEIVILFKSESLIHLPLTCYEGKNNALSL